MLSKVHSEAAAIKQLKKAATKLFERAAIKRSGANPETLPRLRQNFS